jgi:hypothetical protein
LEFPEVFFDTKGNTLEKLGFDAYMGNPPYVRVELLNNYSKGFLKVSFSTIVDRCDIYIGFIEHGLRLLKKGGRLGFIVSGQFMTADYGSSIRFLLEQGHHLSSILDLEPLQVFEGATTYPIILGCEKSSANSITAASALEITDNKQDADDVETMFNRMLDKKRIVPIANLNQSPWLWIRSSGQNLSNQMISSTNFTVSDLCNISSSLKSGRDSILTAPIVSYEKRHYRIILGGYETTVVREFWRPILRAEQLSIWQTLKAGEVVFFPYEIQGRQFILLPEERIRSGCSATFQYLSNHRRTLEERRDSRKTWAEHGRPWYSLHRIGKPDDYKPPRLLSPGEFSKNRFALSMTGDLWPCARIIGISKSIVPIGALQLFLNSDEVWAYMRATFPPKRGGYRGMSVGDLAAVPCPARSSPIWDVLEQIARGLDVQKITAEGEEEIRREVSRALISLQWS